MRYAQPHLLEQLEPLPIAFAGFPQLVPSFIRTYWARFRVSPAVGLFSNFLPTDGDDDIARALLFTLQIIPLRWS